MAGEILAASSSFDIKTIQGLAVAAAATGIVGSIFKPYVRIEPGTEAVRVRGGTPSTYRWGKKKGMIKVLPAGKHLKNPPSHEFKEYSTKEQTTSLAMGMVDLKDGKQVDVEAKLSWKNVSSESHPRYFIRRWRGPGTRGQENDLAARRLFNTEDQETLTTIAADALRRAIEEAVDGKHRDSLYLTEQVKAGCNDTWAGYGAMITRITMPQCATGGPDQLGKYISQTGPDSDPSGVLAAAGGLDSIANVLHLVKPSGTTDPQGDSPA